MKEHLTEDDISFSLEEENKPKNRDNSVLPR